jgi:hypothetical protein
MQINEPAYLLFLLLFLLLLLAVLREEHASTALDLLRRAVADPDPLVEVGDDHIQCRDRRLLLAGFAGADTGCSAGAAKR